MKKLKPIILSCTLLFALISAFFSRPHWDCTGVQNFYFNGQVYIPAGVFGEDYYCAFSTNTCTYYQITFTTYAACRMGDYSPLLKKK